MGRCHIAAFPLSLLSYRAWIVGDIPLYSFPSKWIDRLPSFKHFTSSVAVVASCFLLLRVCSRMSHSVLFLRGHKGIKTQNNTLSLSQKALGINDYVLFVKLNIAFIVVVRKFSTKAKCCWFLTFEIVIFCHFWPPGRQYEGVSRSVHDPPRACQRTQTRTLVTGASEAILWRGKTSSFLCCFLAHFSLIHCNEFRFLGPRTRLCSEFKLKRWYLRLTWRLPDNLWSWSSIGLIFGGLQQVRIEGSCQKVQSLKSEIQRGVGTGETLLCLTILIFQAFLKSAAESEFETNVRSLPTTHCFGITLTIELALCDLLLVWCLADSLGSVMVVVNLDKEYWLNCQVLTDSWLSEKKQFGKKRESPEMFMRGERWWWLCNDFVTSMILLQSVFLCPAAQNQHRGPAKLFCCCFCFTQGYCIVTDYFSSEELEPCRQAAAGLVDGVANKLFDAGKIKSKMASKNGSVCFSWRFPFALFLFCVFDLQTNMRSMICFTDLHALNRNGLEQPSWCLRTEKFQR